MTVDSKIYNSEKKAFFNKHDNDFQVYTSSMDENSRYMKTYAFADSAQWIEVIQTAKTVTLRAVAEFAGMEFPIAQDITLCQVEYWNTDDANARYFYER